MLILQPLNTGDIISEASMMLTPIWLQVHGLSMEKTTKADAHVVALKARDVIEVDLRSNRTA